MEKVYNKISGFFLNFIVAFSAVIFGIVLLFRLPCDYIRYKTSPYYKKERKKYEMFAGSSINFRICNIVIKNKLPVSFIADTEDDLLENMSFVSGDILIIPNIFSITYDDKNSMWECLKEDERDTSQFSLDDFIEMEIERVNYNAGKKICTKAVVLTKGNNVDNINAAKNDSRFLIYKNNPEEVLKDFCERITL